MKIIEWLRDIFLDKSSVEITEKMNGTAYQLAVEEFAVHVAVNLIASTVSMCEFRTLAGGRFQKKEDYYRFNVEPNPNQNAQAFLRELVTKLLYRNECLVIEQGGKLIIADSFTKQDLQLYPSCFSNVTRGDFTFQKTFYANEVMYFTYANANIRALLHHINHGYDELLRMATGKYRRAGGKKVVIKTDATPQQDQKWQKALDDLYGNRFRSFFHDENALVVLPRGIEYGEPGSETRRAISEVSDIVSITKEAFYRTAQAFQIPPQFLTGEVSDTESLKDTFLTFGIKPVCNIVQTEINRSYYGKAAFLRGYRVDIDTTKIQVIDVFRAAEKADKLISSGLYCIDELREKLGDLPLDTWWSRKHWMTKNYEEIELTEGKKGEMAND